MNLNISSIGIENKNVKEVNNIIKYVEKEILNIEEKELLDLIHLLLEDSRKSINKIGLSLLKYKEKMEKEILRVKNLYDFDKLYAKNGYVIGVDEVGRGPLAGPIVAAAVVLDLNYKSINDLILEINDSKKISFSKRYELSKAIKKSAIAYKIALIDNTCIDKKGIGWCNNEVFLQAAKGIDLIPNMVLSDGYSIKGIDLPNKAVIKGDSKSASIACASILAKVFRDNIMMEYSKNYPNYGFEKNMGYGTQEHIESIKKNGITSIHRKSFLNNI